MAKNGAIGRTDFEPTPGLDAWTIQPDETDEAFTLFQQFRDMGGKRTLISLARVLAQNEDGFAQLAAEDRAERISRVAKNLAYHSARHHWQARCRAFDSAVDAERVVARLEAERKVVKEATERHARLATGMQAMAAQFIQRFMSDETWRASRINDMSFGEVINLIKSGVSLDRLLLNVDSQAEADRNEARIGNQPLPQMPGHTPDELKKIATDAAREAVANEPKPVKLTPPPEDDADGAQTVLAPDAARPRDPGDTG